MENQNNQNTINVEPFMDRINAYVFKFMDRSITGRLVEKNGEYITVELKSGGVFIANIDSLVSIWHIRQRQEVK